MKVITVKQPFATLIVKGVKQYEFRTWKTKYRGDILIHAGKGVDKKALARFKHFGFDYPSGCILGSVTIVDCVKMDEKMREILAGKNKEVYGSIIKHTEWEGYGFQLKNAKEMEPIYINGHLSFWEYEGDIKWKEK